LQPQIPRQHHPSDRLILMCWWYPTGLGSMAFRLWAGGGKCRVRESLLFAWCPYRCRCGPSWL